MKVSQCPNCSGPKSMMRAPWYCSNCGAKGAGSNVSNLGLAKPGINPVLPQKDDKIYICPWSKDNDEHEQGAYNSGICKVCGRCPTCGLTKDYHTRGGASECTNALAKRVDELEQLINVAKILDKTTCRCGRIATEHECGECYGI